MFAKTFKIAAMAALTAATLAPVAAEARPHYRGDGYYGRGDARTYAGNRGYGNRGYSGGRYSHRCRDKGTGGTIIGAIAGGLLGHEVGEGRYNRGDGTAGAIVGAGVGALAGRAIDRNC